MSNRTMADMYITGADPADADLCDACGGSRASHGGMAGCVRFVEAPTTGDCDVCGGSCPNGACTMPVDPDGPAKRRALRMIPPGTPLAVVAEVLRAAEEIDAKASATARVAKPSDGFVHTGAGTPADDELSAVERAAERVLDAARTWAELDMRVKSLPCASMVGRALDRLIHQRSEAFDAMVCAARGLHAAELATVVR